MPTLPSGMVLALLTDHIMKPDRNWFRAAENHFWYATPDEAASPPPFSPEDTIIRKYVEAPIPESREQMARYIKVCIGLPDGMMFWRGDLLSDFPRYGDLTCEDLAAWHAWVQSDGVREFLDRTIIKCKTQAAINREAKGYALFRVSDDKGDDGYVVAEKVIDNPLKNSN